jgi:hypothetical protein
LGKPDTRLAGRMIQITAQMRVLVAIEPASGVAFQKHYIS